MAISSSRLLVVLLLASIAATFVALVTLVALLAFVAITATAAATLIFAAVLLLLRLPLLLRLLLCLHLLHLGFVFQTWEEALEARAASNDALVAAFSAAPAPEDEAD